jgi:hypothetical protein
MRRLSLGRDMGPLARSPGLMGGQKRKRWTGRGRDAEEKKEVRGEWPRRRIRGIARVKEVGVVRGVKVSKIGKGERADRKFPTDLHAHLLISSDGGVKTFLKDVYEKIKALELELNEIHKAMSHDNSPSVSRDADLRSKKVDVDTAAWLDLIVKHKK